MVVTKDLIKRLDRAIKEPSFTIPEWCKTREQRRKFMRDCAKGLVEPDKS
ncbi:hypothetical protein BAHKABFF_00017 [Salmonella phage CF-SP1]|nr:hypothetical protein BAHKABFF_00017 [Salmonella phage CF-SP1]